MAPPPRRAGGAQLLRTLQGAPDVRLTACCLQGERQIATGSQDGTLLLWHLAAGRPRPSKLGVQRGQVTCLRAAGKTLVSGSMDSTVSIWNTEKSKTQKAATLKLHFAPVRCVDVSLDQRLLLTGSDDKTLKLSSVAQHKFLASFLGHSNWLRTASLSPSASHIVSGGDDKTVRLWDVEQKSCVQTFYDSASSITCAKFGLGENIIVASAWDSSINIWDVRSFQLRQHYGRAHGSSPITAVAVHPRDDVILSCGADRQLRLWDLRAGRLRNTILGHDRPIHSCGWDETGEHFMSCDSELVFYWSVPPRQAEETVEPPAEAAEAPEKEAVPPTPPSPEPSPSGAVTSPPVAQPKLGELLEAAWAGEQVLRSKVAGLPDELPEAAALTLEKMVSDMDGLTELLQSLELRMAETEAMTAEVQQLLRRDAAVTRS